ncbi:MAG: hypothetical protein JM58_04395 [Peptococcaceae bacterium BICA1-8]|nr:MAG: hypothetical protein JM58_04395 [Peptococcaceae bacterium BICA1-8]
MSNDLFGGLLKGLGSFMPQDDPDTKIFTANNELNGLQKQEMEAYAAIGKKALGSITNDPAYSDIINELGTIQKKLVQAENQLKAVKEEKEALKTQQEALRCPECSTVNPEGVKFCQECGSKLGMASCSKCGATNTPQTRFCGECGNKL